MDSERPFNLAAIDPNGDYWVYQFLPFLKTLACDFTSNTHDREDLVWDTLAKAREKQNQLRTAKNLQAYLRKMMANVWADKHKLHLLNATEDQLTQVKTRKANHKATEEEHPEDEYTPQTGWIKRTLRQAPGKRGRLFQVAEQEGWHRLRMARELKVSEKDLNRKLQDGRDWFWHQLGLNPLRDAYLFCRDDPLYSSVDHVHAEDRIFRTRVCQLGRYFDSMRRCDVDVESIEFTPQLFMGTVFENRRDYKGRSSHFAARAYELDGLQWHFIALLHCEHGRYDLADRSMKCSCSCFDFAENILLDELHSAFCAGFYDQPESMNIRVVAVFESHIARNQNHLLQAKETIRSLDDPEK